MSGIFPRRARLLEFSVAVVVIGVVSLFLLVALARIEEDAERMMVETTIRNMNTGLRLNEAELIVQGRESERAGLLQVNPVTWLERPPTGYLEVERLADGQPAPGQWVWARASRELNYLPRRAENLRVEGGDKLAWRVVAAGGASVGEGIGIWRPGTLRVDAVHRYDWKP